MVKQWTRSEEFRIFLAASSALVSVCIFLFGCSRTGRMPLAPVHGRVTYQGRPVVKATVEFLCPGASRPAAGMTDDQGNYQLTTFAANDGAMIGTHVVTVNVNASESEAALPSVSGMDSKAKSKAIEDAARQSARHQQIATKSLPQIPKKYGARKISGLSKEVASGDNTINIELSD